MAPSILRQKLLTIRQLAAEAICSREGLHELECLWTEVKNLLTQNPPKQEDQRLLAVLSYNHTTLAGTMAKLESFHETLISDACREVADGETCKY
jgi:hypothetical protein